MNLGGLKKSSPVVLGLLIVGLALAPRSALANNWYILATDANGMALVDLATIQHLADGTYAEQMQIYSDSALMHVPGVKLPVRRQESKLEIDCKKKESRLIELTLFAESRDPIGHANASGQQAAWMPSGQGWANPALLELACGGKPNPKQVQSTSDILQIQKVYVASTSGKTTTK